MLLLFNQITINQIALKHHVSFSNLTNDLDIKRDSEFLNKMHQVMTNGNTSKLFVPYLSQFRVTYQKAQRSVKKRIEYTVRSHLSITFALSGEGVPQNGSKSERG